MEESSRKWYMPDAVYIYIYEALLFYVLVAVNVHYLSVHGMRRPDSISSRCKQRQLKEAKNNAMQALTRNNGKKEKKEGKERNEGRKEEKKKKKERHCGYFENDL